MKYLQITGEIFTDYRIAHVQCTHSNKIIKKNNKIHKKYFVQNTVFHVDRVAEIIGSNDAILDAFYDAFYNGV